MGNIEYRHIAFAGPQVYCRLRLSTKRDNCLNARRLGGIVQLIAPACQSRVRQNAKSCERLARMKRKQMRIEAEVRARQPELGQKSLNALSRISDEVPPHQAFGRTGVRCNAQEPCAA